MHRTKNWLLVAAGMLLGLFAGLLLFREPPFQGPSPDGRRDKQEAPATKPVPPTKVATSFDGRELLESVIAGHTSSAGWPAGLSRVDPVFARQSESVVCRLKNPQAAGTIADSLERKIEKHIEDCGATLFQRHDFRSNAGDATIRHAVRGYRLTGRSGKILVWTTHQGDYLSLVLFLYEISGEETVPSPLPGPADGRSLP